MVGSAGFQGGAGLARTTGRPGEIADNDPPPVGPSTLRTARSLLQESESARFHAWNTAGDIAWRLGKGLHALGLWLCGLAGTFHAIADSHR